MKRQLNEALDLFQSAKVYDLGVDLFAGMPRYPSHPPFLYGMAKRHGDMVNAVAGREISSAVDAISTGTHVGTHIDGLGHFSCNGCLYRDVPVEGNQSYERGLARHGVDTIAPILRRGVLLDVAGLFGSKPLSADFMIEPEHLAEACRAQDLEVRQGDIALIRTGWGAALAGPGRVRDGREGKCRGESRTGRSGGQVAQRQRRIRRWRGQPHVRKSALRVSGTCSSARRKRHPHH